VWSVPTLAAKTKTRRGWGTHFDLVISSHVPKCEDMGHHTFIARLDIPLAPLESDGEREAESTIQVFTAMMLAVIPPAVWLLLRLVGLTWRF